MATEPGKKVVVIIGASSGIGRAAAQAFARTGCRLVLAARSEAALEIAARECVDTGGQAIPFPSDVTKMDEMAQLAAIAKQRFGQLDVWVNDAGIHLPGRFEDVPLEDFHQVIHVNLMGTVHGCRAALPVFRAQGHGVLINIAGAVGLPFASADVASKWAVRGLSEAVRMELQDNAAIQVCTILPPGSLSPEEVADRIVALAHKPQPEAFMGMGRWAGGWSNRSTALMAAIGAALVAVPMGLYAWRKMRERSAYV